MLKALAPILAATAIAATIVPGLPRSLITWSSSRVRQHYFAKWDHVARSLRDGGKVFVEVRDSGEVTFHEGFVTTKDAARNVKAQSAGDGEAPETSTNRPEMTQPLQTYFELHRHAAVLAKLFQHPDVALRSMVTHAIVGSSL